MSTVSSGSFTPQHATGTALAMHFHLMGEAA
jgi:hypothetical protein